MRRLISEQSGRSPVSHADPEFRFAASGTKSAADGVSVGGYSATLVMLRYLAAIRHHAWRIALFVAGTFLVTGFILLRMPKEYEGTATVRVDPSAPVDGVSNQSENSNQFDMGPQLATDMREIVSPSVVTPVVVKLGLIPSAGGSKAHVSAVVSKVSGGVKVQQVNGTYLINISYRSKSPGEVQRLRMRLPGISQKMSTEPGAALC